MSINSVLRLFICPLLIGTGFFASGQNRYNPKPDPNLLKLIDRGFAQSAAQYRILMKRLPENRFPVAFHPGDKKMITSGTEPWVGGFYPGALLYLFENNGDSIFYKEAAKKLDLLEREKTNTTTHDLGFMMYCSFGNANRLEQKGSYEDILVASARSLASRFNNTVGCIRSWDSDPSQYMVIIDNMMNLELLFEATKISGDSSFYKIAVAHADTSMRNHFRSDYSSYHLIIYDPVTGVVLKKQTVQGASDESAWARGQAWGLYGYTMSFRETGNPTYLEMACHIADFILNHSNLPEDKIPYWDFNAPTIPDAPHDASAAAILCSALIELSGYVDVKTQKKYLNVAETILRSLLSGEYSAALGSNGGFLLKHGVGNFPNNAEIDAALIYSDYYFLEAMQRYKNLVKSTN